MAKSTRTRRNLTQFPKSTEPPADPAATPTAVLDPSTDPATPFDAAPPPEPEKPRKTPKTLTFFQRLASIDRGDWTGERAKVKLYRLAPLINRLAGSEHKFVAIYYEPITEEKLKVDHGSGRYRLYLNYKNAGIKEEKELDMVELDILDPAYPPKIPPGEWLDDPRNKQWAWARPAGAGQQPGQPTGAEGTLAAFNTFLNIQDRVQERMTPAEDAKTATPVDPWSAAEKILNMRSENPMVAILQQQMKDAAAATEAERARAFTAAEAARDREFKLQEKLMEAKTSAPQPKSLFDQIGELVGPETVKKFIGDIFSGKGPGEAITRSSRVTGLEVARDITTKLIDSDILSGIGQWLAAKAQQNAAMSNPAATTMNGTAVQNGVQQPEQDFNAFLRDVLNPALLRHYTQGFSGADFAGWLYDGYPDRVAQLQNFTHPLAPGLKGAPVIIAGYKRTAHMWPALSVRGEEAFTQFVNDFCAWKPESTQDAQEAETEDVEGQVIDLDDTSEARVS